ncbi:MAG: acyl-CoA dehydrogenase family protein, partial [Bdellovibrionota bacterium]
GSDVSGISTTCRKDGDYWILNGRKCFITNGGKADWVIVFATLDKSKGREAHRAFIVEKGTPGFYCGKIEKKMGLRCSETAELVLDDVRIHKDQVLGGEDHYEKMGAGGFKTAMKTFDSTRPMVASMALGITRAAFEEARDFVKEAYCLSRPLPHYRALSEKVVDWERKIDAARLLIWHAAWLADKGIPNSKEASMSKAYAGKISKEICREAYQLVAGRGSPREPWLDKFFRDIQIFDIFEGTGQVQRLIISRRFMQGLQID